MNTWKIILATVVIFGAGVITGGLLVSHADRVKAKQLRPRAGTPIEHWTPPLREFPRRPEQELQLHIEQRRIEFLLHASRELKLSPEQRERIERLIRESQERTRQLWERVGPQMRREVAEVKEKIREELTPPQRKRFEELMKRQQARRPDEGLPPAARLREARRLGVPRDVPPPEAPGRAPVPPRENPPPPPPGAEPPAQPQP